MSHELRTPLASVLGYTELLLTRETDGETRNRCLRAVHAEAIRLRELIDDFLDLQRIERGGVEPAMERIDLRPLLTEQVERLGGVSERHTLQVVAPSGPLVVDADRTRIGQVVANLVSNAIKYSPDGGPVRIEATHAEGEVRVAVADSGSASRPTSRPRSSSASSAPATAATGRSAGRASGSRSSARSSRRTAARSASRASRTAARASGSACPLLRARAPPPRRRRRSRETARELTGGCRERPSWMPAAGDMRSRYWMY